MADQIKIIKTLPHLSKIFMPQNQIVAFSHIYSKDIIKYFNSLNLVKKENLKYSSLTKYLENDKTKFERVNQVSDILEYSIKGDVIIFWPVGYKHPVKAEFFGEDIEKVYSIDEIYNTKIYDVFFLILSEYIPQEKLDQESILIQVPDKLNSLDIYKLIIPSVWNTDIKRDKNNLDIMETDYSLPPLFYSRLDILEKEVLSYQVNNYKTLIYSKNQESLPKDLQNLNGKIFGHKLDELDLAAGFISEKEKILLLTDREIFGSIYLTRPEKTKKFSGNIKKLLRQLEGSIEINDYIVHEDYGIGIYAGLTQELIDNELREYILIKYDKEDELYVPLTQIEKITKYIGNEGVDPKITRLGRQSWENVKQKIKKSASLIAKDLIEHFAKREISKAKPISKKTTSDFEKFVDLFEFKETEDQLRATSEIINDLEQDKPMDRLLVGDVGFGKTEVIMRAAFKIVESGGQAAVLSPTTVLTAQHYKTFTERFKEFPISIGFISRFKSAKENKDTINLVNEGKIDILIGTHRILGNDVKFKDLQLIVVDEEQRFGVKQKEKIKKLNYKAHMLAVSATPIPRTLSMALSSIQDLSIITTPPVNRKSVYTEIIRSTENNNSWNKIAEAIQKEVSRGGQIFFIHNEVSTIQSIQNRLIELCPNIKFTFAHGQMNSNELDKIMYDFHEKKFDCLISTTIIENGIDLSNVNTIMINKAHRFGLSQLYQLRGRVGRSETQSYCYLLYEGRDLDSKKYESQDIAREKMTGVKAKQKNRNYLHRLQSLVDNQDLGSGFRIASRDLEIRGAGNLLGEQQSGHISVIGYALYIELLAEEIERVKQLQIHL